MPASTWAGGSLPRVPLAAVGGWPGAPRGKGGGTEGVRGGGTDELRAGGASSGDGCSGTGGMLALGTVLNAAEDGAAGGATVGRAGALGSRGRSDEV
jgi:hypothetical protein